MNDNYLQHWGFGWELGRLIVWLVASDVYNVLWLWERLHFASRVCINELIMVFEP